MTLPMKTVKNIIQMAIYSRPSIQNANNLDFWIRKKNALFNLIKKQDSGNLIWQDLFVCKRLKWAKYQFLIKKCEGAGIKHLNDTKTFIEYSAYMDDVCSNINDYKPAIKRKF